MTQIIKSNPPNFPQIVKKFRLAQNPYTVFAYAPNIYSRAPNIPAEILAHEMVHIKRQEHIGVEVWWDNYLTFAQFRYDEELLAHRAEYQCLLQIDPKARKYALKAIGKKLVAPLYNYGQIITLDKAMRDLQS